MYKLLYNVLTVHLLQSTFEVLIVLLSTEVPLSTVGRLFFEGSKFREFALKSFSRIYAICHLVP